MSYVADDKRFPITLTLLRHGETQHNREKRIQGRDSPLSEKGRQQARKAAEFLSEENFAAVYFSPFRRAAETAEIIRKTVRSRFIEEPLLSEKRWGRFEGALWEEVKGKLNFSDSGGLGNLSSTDHGGESWRAAESRAQRFLEKIRRQKKGNFLAISHAEFLRVLIFSALSLPLGKSRRIHLSNCALTEISLNGRWARLNCLNRRAGGP